MMSCTHSPPLTKTVDQFLLALRASHLLSPQQVQSLPELPATDVGDSQSWVSGLVASGILTEYQAEQLLAGQGDVLVLGQYHILDRLGAGGMGQVYKAEHALMRRLVALKVIMPHLVRDASAVARFHGEVQVAAQLCHPNIVAAFDADEANGLHFLVMEYVEGIDLGQLVEENGPLPVALACEYVRQAALGLGHAHEHGLVHCDIKPSNLLLRQGVTLSGLAQPPLIKILDFGLARLIGSPAAKATVLSLTGLGSNFAGTPDYMAPEQAHDYESADIRSDLYSLGCTFFYLLTAQVPYFGGTWSEKLLRHQFEETPELTHLRPDVPADVAALVQRLMAKEPAERFQTPAELADALFACLSRHSALGDLPLIPSAVDVKARLSRDAVDGSEVLSASSAGINPAEAVAGRRRILSRRRLIWPTTILGAIATGLALAWTARSISLAPVAAPQPAVLGAATVNHRILLASMPGKIFVRLDAAVASARDGDTLVIHGDGSYATRPLVILGKSLTLKAESGCRPRIELNLEQKETEWQSLITCDRPLVLEGLGLYWKPTDRPSVHRQATHLVYSEGTSVRLADCHLLAPHGSALLVCRNAGDVEVCNCLVVADSSAICVEVKAGLNAQVALIDNQFMIGGSHGAAVCIWKSAAAEQSALSLNLRHNVIEAGRVLSLTGLERSVEISAQGNTLRFREALLSFAGLHDSSCQNVAAWRGQDNQYKGASNWLTLNGTSTGVRDLTSWREYWKTSETGSFEETSSIPLETAHHAPLN
jgi:serine/threonine protein kinase